MKIRRLLRILHRDFGYFITGMLLIYAISGIAINHRKDWNPDYYAVSETIDLPTQAWSEISEAEVQQILKKFEVQPVYKKHIFSQQELVKVFVENGMVVYDPLAGKAELELLMRRPVLYHINKLHMAATTKAWVWISDILSVILIFVAISGLFLLKGKHSITRRGLWLTLAGFIIPLFFLIFYIS